MPKRKEDVLHNHFEGHHHDMWLSNIVALVVVLVFGVYTMMTRDALSRLTNDLNVQLAALQEQCLNK